MSEPGGRADLRSYGACKMGSVANDTLAVLKIAREAVARGWTQGPLAVNDAGAPVHPWYNGTKRCARGGLMLAVGAQVAAQIIGGALNPFDGSFGLPGWQSTITVRDERDSEPRG